VIGPKLALDAAAAIRPFFLAQLYPSSIYSLLSVMAWRNADGFEVSYAVEGDLLLVAAERAGERHLALPIGNRMPAPAELRDIARRLEFPEIWYVPEEYVAAFGADAVRAAFDLVEHREWAEYIFLAEDLDELKGKRLSPKRNLIRQFEKNYVETGRALAGPIREADVAECIAFLEAWCEERGCEHADQKPLACERRAAEAALCEMHALGAEGVAVRVDSRIVGFGIGYRVTDALGALHFEKAFASIKGLYQYLDRECARRLFRGRFERVTKESDMGLPGLAHAKQSYGPSAVTPCYSLSLRP
jgi:uncharacterized protein